MKKKRRLPKPLWNEYVGRNERRMLPARNVKSRSSVELGGVAPCVVWREKGPGDRRSTTMSAEPRGLVLTPSPTLWGGVNMSGLRRGTHQSPTWAGDLWSASPMHHQQLAARMVCSWKLVKAYQQTQTEHLHLSASTPCDRGLQSQGQSRQPQRAGYSRVCSPSVRPCVAVCIVLQ